MRGLVPFMLALGTGIPGAGPSPTKRGIWTPLRATLASATGAATDYEIIQAGGAIYDANIGDPNRALLSSNAQNWFLIDTVGVEIDSADADPQDVGTLLNDYVIQVQSATDQAYYLPTRDLVYTRNRIHYEPSNAGTDASVTRHGEPYRLPVPILLHGTQDSFNVTVPQTTAIVQTTLRLGGIAWQGDVNDPAAAALREAFGAAQPYKAWGLAAELVGRATGLIRGTGRGDR
jgi:hypothetical protein